MYSAWGPENKKNAANLKSRVLGAKARDENLYFSLSMAIRDGITDDNDLCTKITQNCAKTYGMKEMNLSFKFNNGRLFIRGAMCMPERMADIVDLLNKGLGKQTTPESLEAGFKLGFNCEDFFAPNAANIPSFITKGMTSKTNICIWEGFHETILNAVESQMQGMADKGDGKDMMLASMAMYLLPFYMTESQGKVDVDLDPEDIAKMCKLPIAEMMNMNADSMINMMTPFGSNDDTEMITDENGIWSEFEGHQNWTQNTRDTAVEAFLDSVAEGLASMEDETKEAPERL